MFRDPSSSEMGAVTKKANGPHLLSTVGTPFSKGFLCKGVGDELKLQGL